MSHLSWGGQCPCATPPTFTTPARGETESQSGRGAETLAEGRLCALPWLWLSPSPPFQSQPGVPRLPGSGRGWAASADHQVATALRSRLRPRFRLQLRFCSRLRLQPWFYSRLRLFSTLSSPGSIPGSCSSPGSTPSSISVPGSGSILVSDRLPQGSVPAQLLWGQALPGVPRSRIPDLSQHCPGSA